MKKNLNKFIVMMTILACFGIGFSSFTMVTIKQYTNTDINVDIGDVVYKKDFINSFALSLSKITENGFLVTKSFSFNNEIFEYNYYSTSECNLNCSFEVEISKMANELGIKNFNNLTINTKFSDLYDIGIINENYSLTYNAYQLTSSINSRYDSHFDAEMKHIETNISCTNFSIEENLYININAILNFEDSNFNNIYESINSGLNSIEIKVGFIYEE